jgi:hypothetical protein
MAGRDVEKVMAGKDTITINQMLSFRGRRIMAALFLFRPAMLMLGMPFGRLIMGI